MGILRFNYRSQALGHYIDISVVFPTDSYSYFDESKRSLDFRMPGDKKRTVYKPGMKFQTIYLIHGGGDDDSLVYRYTNAERYAQDNHVMLVTPNIANSFGINTAYGVKYSTFLTEELPVVIQSLFASSPRREDNFIVGYAMGGNVALGTALVHPELYAECVDMSGGIGMTLCTETLQDELNGDYFIRHFPLYNISFGKGKDIPGSCFDIRKIAEEHIKKNDPRCRFHIICGSDEFIRARVEGDVKALREMGYEIDYLVPEGYAHEFRLWDNYLKVVMDKILPLRKAAIYPEEKRGGQ